VGDCIDGLTLGDKLQYLHARDGLVELVNIIFMTRTLKTVVQVRSVRQDKLTEDPNKVRGVEVELRSVQFVGVQDIEAKLKDLTQQGMSLPSSLIIIRRRLGKIRVMAERNSQRRGQCQEGTVDHFRSLARHD
jgi:hypothetical protein